MLQTLNFIKSIKIAIPRLLLIISRKDFITLYIVELYFIIWATEGIAPTCAKRPIK